VLLSSNLKHDVKLLHLWILPFPTRMHVRARTHITACDEHVCADYKEKNFLKRNC